MVDFRYLVVTIIAVFLALGIGILMGSGFVGDALISDLEGNVEEVRGTNRELNEQVDRLNARLEVEKGSLAAFLEPLVGGSLAGTRVVLLQVERTDREMTDAVTSALEIGEAEVAATITLSEKLALDEREDITALADTLETSNDQPDGPDGLRRQLGGLLGRMLSESASDSAADDPPAAGTDAAALEELLAALEDHGFVAVDALSARTVPPRARFVLVGGGLEPPPFPLQDVVAALCVELSNDAEDAAVVVESLSSIWDLVGIVRSDGNLSARLSTVDDIETSIGSLSLVVALDGPLGGPAQHYGSRDGATMPGAVLSPRG